MNSYGDEDIRIERDNSGTEIYIFDPYNPLNVEIKQSTPIIIYSGIVL